MKGSWVIPLHSPTNSLSLPPMGTKLFLLHGLWSRLLGSLYDGLERPSFGGFCLLTEQSVSTERTTSDSGVPSNGLDSWLLCWVSLVNDIPGESLMPILAVTFLHMDVTISEAFCTSSRSVFTTSSGCGCLERLIILIFNFFWLSPLHCGTNGLGRFISRPCFLSRIMACNDPKSELFQHMFPWEKVVILERAVLR